MAESCALNTEGVCFDPEDITLLGVYADELSLFRAKQGWKRVLETNFMLEDEHDFKFTLSKDYNGLKFNLSCHFDTACGRYAFWRLTNYQAPEAQYEIETAHIPSSSSRHDDLVTALDMLPIYSTPLITTGLKETKRSSLVASMLKKFRKKIS